MGLGLVRIRCADITEKMGRGGAWFECPYCVMLYRWSEPEQNFEEYLKKHVRQGEMFKQRLKNAFPILNCH